MKLKPVRTGASMVQMAIVLAALGITVIATVQLLGTSTSGELDQTASQAADPAQLVGSFGSHSGTSSGSGSSSDGGGSSGGGSSNDSGNSGGGGDSSGDDSGGGSDEGGMCP